MNRLKPYFARLKETVFLRVSFQERMVFIKQLGVLIKAGSPLLSSLHMLQESSKNRSMRTIFGHVIAGVENGQYLATSLGKYKKVFGELAINIIAVGEISGSLTNNLDHLAANLKKQHVLRRKVFGALVYPMFIVSATLVMVVMLMVFFFPKVVPVFKSINYDLPWSTKFLIFISNLFKNYGFVMLAGIVVVIITGLLLLRIKKVRRMYDKTLVRLPFFKKFICTYNITNTFRTLGLLLNGGVTVVRSFEITADTTVNTAYQETLSNIAKAIMKGEKISAQFKTHKKLFPHMVAQLVEVGENTGKLSETFLYLADVYEEDMDDLTKNISTAVEPLLLILMGILVGFIAISIITPIYGITQHLTPK